MRTCCDKVLDVFLTSLFWEGRLEEITNATGSKPFCQSLACGAFMTFALKVRANLVVKRKSYSHADLVPLKAIPFTSSVISDQTL